MRRLSRQEQSDRDSLAQAIDDARSRLETAISEYNAKVAELWEPLQNAIDAYNGAAVDAELFRDGIVSQMEDYMGERSETWTDSNAGVLYGEWKDSWESASIGLIEIDQPDDVDIPDIEGADALRDLESRVAD